MQIEIPVTKAKGSIMVETGELNDDVMAEVILQGLKVLLNRGTTKITKALYENDDEKMKADALAMAQKQLEKLKAGQVKATKASADKTTGAEKTEAMRIARNLVKDEMKRQGIKVSHVAASEITAYAKEVLADHPEILDQARENLKARESTKLGIDLKGKVKEDPKKVAAAEARKAKAKETLSATQAGKPKLRVKGKGGAAQLNA